MAAISAFGGEIMSTAVVSESPAGSLAPLVVKLGDVPPEREVVQCDYCRLMQYRTTTDLCRKCHRPLPPFSSIGKVLLSAVQAALTYKKPSAEKPTAEEAHRTVGLPDAVREVRRIRHLSQCQLAARMDVPRTYISKIENGQAMPTVGSIERFAEALGVSPLDLVTFATGSASEVRVAYETLLLEGFVARNIKVLYPKKEAILAALAKAFPLVSSISVDGQ